MSILTKLAENWQYIPPIILLLGIVGYEIFRHLTVPNYRSHHKLVEATLLVAVSIFCSNLSSTSKISDALFAIVSYFMVNVNIEPDTHLFAKILMIVAPLLTAGAILSVLSIKLQWFRYFLVFRKAAYLFSELNDNSLAIAKDVSSKDRHAFIVFYKTSNNDEENEEDELSLRSQAKKLRALFMPAAIASYDLASFRAKHRKNHIFLIDQDESNNLQNVITMANSAKEARSEKKANSRYPSFYVFSSEESAPYILDPIISGSYVKGNDNQDRVFYEIRYINPARIIAQEMVRKNHVWEPLIQNNLCGTDKDMNVVILGGGSVGLETVKAILNDGMLSNHKLKIWVLDRDADKSRAHFYSDYPAFKDDTAYPGNLFCIKFLPCEFEGTLDEQLSSLPEIQYAVVCSDNDELNIRTAAYLQHWFVRKDISENHSWTFRKILCLLRSRARYDTVAPTENKRLPMVSFFGHGENMLSLHNLQFRAVDILAAEQNAGYNEPEQKDQTTEDPFGRAQIEKAHMRSYLTAPLVNQLSSQAAILHIHSKFFQLVESASDLSAGEKEQLYSYLIGEADHNNPARLLCSLIPNKDSEQPPIITAERYNSAGLSLFDRACLLEHDRWSVEQVLLGDTVYTPEELHHAKDSYEYCKNATRKHKVEEGRMHAAIVEYPILLDIEKEASTELRSYDWDMFHKLCILYQEEVSAMNHADHAAGRSSVSSAMKELFFTIDPKKTDSQ